MLNPPITGNEDLDAFLYNIYINGVGESTNTTTVNTDASSGEPVGYTYQYIHIKYADDNVGTNMSNTPDFKMYWGIYNSESSTESTNPTDYTWYQSPVGFGSLTKLYYTVLGGRNIKFALDIEAPSYQWKQDDGNPVDIDIIIPPQTITHTELVAEAVRELNIAEGAVTANKTNIAALDQATGGLNPNTVSAAQILEGAVTELKLLDGAVTENKIYAGSVTSDKVAANAIGANQIAANAVTAVKINAGAVTATKIATDAVTADKIIAGAVTAVKIDAGAVTADKISVTDLSAINANMGTITAGSLSINNKFIVDSSGNATVRSSTTGARMEIKNNVIKVYDSSNVLRVQIGDLSA